jgi:hypothetical protein
MQVEKFWNELMEDASYLMLDDESAQTSTKDQSPTG